MGKMKIDQYVVGPVQTNCYFVVNEETNEILIMDPGASAKQLAERIRRDNYTPAAILLNQCGMVGEHHIYHADIFLKDEQELDIAGFHIRVLFTPGHTPGGCCYYFPYENVVFSGDSLFCMSIGRTDFPGGSASQLIRAVKEKLMVLPDNTVVYTGHNDPTTIEQERMYNPYL